MRFAGSSDQRGGPPRSDPMGDRKYLHTKINLGLFLVFINDGRSVILHHVTSYFLKTALHRQFPIPG
jgi:hypothetical protein